MTNLFELTIVSLGLHIMAYAIVSGTQSPNLLLTGASMAMLGMALVEVSNGG